jgi:hypothetical protein
MYLRKMEKKEVVYNSSKKSTHILNETLPAAEMDSPFKIRWWCSWPYVAVTWQGGQVRPEAVPKKKN